MNNQRHSVNKLLVSLRLIIIVSTLPTIISCSTAPSSVMVTSSTIIGVDISQDPATQAPSATLGYKRAEFAYVPTNKGTSGKTTTTTSSGGDTAVVTSDGQAHTGSGAKDSANALMELRYSGIFSTGSDSGIYQRVAVGDIAGQQTGASVLLAKNASGKVDENAAKYMQEAKNKIQDEEAKLDIIIAFLKDSSGALDAIKRDTLISKA